LPIGYLCILIKNTIIKYGYIEVLERMIGSYQLTKRQKEAMNYAITSVRMIERMKPLIKDLGLIMKE